MTGNLAHGAHLLGLAGLPTRAHLEHGRTDAVRCKRSSRTFLRQGERQEKIPEPPHADQLVIHPDSNFMGMKVGASLGSVAVATLTPQLVSAQRRLRHGEDSAASGSTKPEVSLVRHLSRSVFQVWCREARLGVRRRRSGNICVRTRCHDSTQRCVKLSVFLDGGDKTLPRG